MQGDEQIERKDAREREFTILYRVGRGELEGESWKGRDERGEDEGAIGLRPLHVCLHIRLYRSQLSTFPSQS